LNLQQGLNEFASILKDTGHVITQDELYHRFKSTQFYKDHELGLLISTAKLFKHIPSIQINPFNEIGLKDWVEVSPGMWATRLI